jgi:hypothetical protein
LSQSPEATDGEPQIDIHDTRIDFTVAAPVGRLSEQPARAGEVTRFTLAGCSRVVRCGKRSSSSKSIITKNATTKARTTCCSSLPLLGLSSVGDMASAVENVSAAYSDTTVAPHEYFDQTGKLQLASMQ